MGSCNSYSDKSSLGFIITGGFLSYILGSIIGEVVGGTFYFLKGICTSPPGARLNGGIEAAEKNVDRVSDKFAEWGALYFTISETLHYLGMEADNLRTIIASAAAGGLPSLHRGLGPASKSAIVGVMPPLLIEVLMNALLLGLGINLEDIVVDKLKNLDDSESEVE